MLTVTNGLNGIVINAKKHVSRHAFLLNDIC